MSCPICLKPTDAKYRPFCSRRCADVDLARWLNESYAIPAPEGEEETPRAAGDEDGPLRD
ncbi:DNA gyrase inhibitor YacG [Pseudotabrizicola algicola]|uniref:DNA gyrase inhibitor YacG n=1 Tax=Pseudotabrizicola algicola TaxID=2709381 RepID=A0A6B3RQR2_9RHOB|nr:DNA gyrase inhibitor YacG [Pseudotabrizicola algicola]NEX48480.1 DNA gyrase inhibitor YacG [Pseudotabrizicola algicola]